MPSGRPYFVVGKYLFGIRKIPLTAVFLRKRNPKLPDVGTDHFLCMDFLA